MGAEKGIGTYLSMATDNLDALGEMSAKSLLDACIIAVELQVS